MLRHSVIIPTGKIMVVLLMGVVLLTGCVPKSVSTTSEQAVAEPDWVYEESDRQCSYFYFLWGRHAELTLQFEEALEAYEKALICDPDSVIISKKIPTILLRMNKADEAARWLEEYLETQPSETSMRMLYAKVLIRLEEFDTAMEQYQLVSQIISDDPVPLIMLSELYLAREQIEDAEKILLRVLKLDAGNYPALVLLARINQFKKKNTRAISYYHKALKVNWSAELMMELGELYTKAEKYPKAIKAYQEILVREREHEGARVALIHVYLQQGKEALALAELEALKAVAENPQRVDLTIAKLYLRQKHFAKAESILLELLEKENVSQARFLLAVIYSQAERQDEALIELRQIPDKSNEFEDALFLQTRILREQGKVDEAIELLEYGISKENVRNAEMFILLAMFYQMQGNDSQGEDAFSKGLNFFPEDEDLLYEFGMFLEYRGEHNRAMEIMQRLIAVKPDNAAALNFIGYTWADKKVHLDKALEYIQRAVLLQPENGYIRDSLGWVYYRLGKLEQAIIELSAAAEMLTADPAVFDHLGDVYLESGMYKEAMQSYKNALDLYKTEEEKLSVQEKLRILQEQENK